MTSTMKSEPGRSMTMSPGSNFSALLLVSVAWATTVGVVAAAAAAVPALRKSRRSMVPPPGPDGIILNFSVWKNCVPVWRTMRAEQNEFLTRTGPGSPMGDLFRRYWLPALLASELPEPDCAPVRIRLLSERLIAFRDTQDRLGLIDEFCAHRGVSLWFGRNEEGGLRCSYHGWKYDVTGQCVEIPS